MSETASTSPAGAARSLWTSKTASTAIFVALAAALGFLLVSVPNVELLTFTVFTSGVVLGRWRGALVGALAMAIYSGANPFGSGLGMPTLFAAQLSAAAVAGLAGGMAAPLWRRGVARVHESRDGRARRVLPAVAAGTAGLVLTVIYQAAVIVGIAAVSPEFRTGAVAVIVSNAFFSTIHLVSNTVIFAVLAPTVLPRVVRLAVRDTNGTTTRP